MPVESWDDAADTGPSKDTLPDGVFDVKIIKWSGKPYEKGDQKGRIVKLRYEVLGVPAEADESKLLGIELEDDRWLTRPMSKRIFFDELKAVGFDVAGWSEGREGDYPKGTMLPLAIKYAKMRGLTLQLKKFTQNGYANLRFVGRKSDDGNPPKVIPNDDVLAVADEIESAEEAF